jgi:hypothetical protein
MLPDSEGRGTFPMTQETIWRKLCKAATLELDPAKLQKRIEAAYAALQQRVEELASNHDGNPVEEQRAIADALQKLRQLQEVAFRSPTQTSQQSRLQAP